MPTRPPCRCEEEDVEADEAELCYLRRRVRGGGSNIEDSHNVLTDEHAESSN